MASSLAVNSRVEGAYRVKIEPGRLYLVKLAEGDADHVGEFAEWLKARWPDTMFIVAARDIEVTELDDAQRDALREVLDG